MPGNEQPRSGSFEGLKAVVSRLRAPDGCPWDREQTHASLKPYLIEETYEVLQALDEENSAKLCEEMGDLLLQIMLHAQLASEAGKFDIHDVINGIATKLIRRHPHVFGESKETDVKAVTLKWEELKKEERKSGESILAGVPRSMPALAFSQSIQRRAAGVGFDWKDAGGVLDKLAEEIGEFKQAKTREEQILEFGDVLFSLVNVARWYAVDSEEALRLANDRFRRRFAYMEEVCRKRGGSIGQLSFDEQNALWDEAKKSSQ